MTGKWIKKMWYVVYIQKYIHTHTHTNTHTHNGMLLSHQKNKIFPFAMTRLELEGSMLSEIS